MALARGSHGRRLTLAVHGLPTAAKSLLWNAGVRDALRTTRNAVLVHLPDAPVGAMVSSIPSGYHLTFHDEFTSLHIADQDGERAFWYTQTIQCCMFDTSFPTTPTHMAGISAPAGQNPYSLEVDGLHIRLQKTDKGWYSGVLASVDKQGSGFAQQYGYFEMKAKFPAASGAWPAFWLLNAAALRQHAPAGEIDVVESFMFAPKYINTTLHDWTPPSKTLIHKLSRVRDLSNGFHTFGLLWTETTMTFSCDGKDLYSMATPAMMKQPYYPIIDLGLGGGWPTDKMPRHADLVVRYLRVYAK